MKKNLKKIMSFLLVLVMILSINQSVLIKVVNAGTWSAPAFNITSAKSTYDYYKYKFTNIDSSKTYSITIKNQHSSTIAVNAKVGLVTADSYTTVDVAYEKFKAGFSTDSSKTVCSPSVYNYWSRTFEPGESATFDIKVGSLNSSAYAEWTFEFEIVDQSTCKHNWNATTGVCKTCGLQCTHKKNTSTGYATKKTATEHTMVYDCAICGMKKAITESGKHTMKATGTAYTSSTHNTRCSVCSYGSTEKCSFTKTAYKKINGNYHYKQTKCVGCTNVSASKLGAHVVKNGKCKYCAAKVLKPGKTKIKKVVNKKSKKIKATSTGHWAGTSWIPSTTSVAYNYPITIKFKKAKNAKKYIIGLTKPSKTFKSLSEFKTTKKTSYNFKNPTMGVKMNKITVYVTPVSKTGTLGKTVKKTVKLKQP